MRGDSNRMDVTLQIVTPHWERVYELRSWMEGLDKAFVRVLSPPKAQGQGYLKLSHRFWEYLPGAERTVLIPPSLMLENFMGSDFSNDDFVKMSHLAEDYFHEFIAEETVEGEPAYLLELHPKPEAAVVYGLLRLWLRRRDAAFLQIEFYNERMERIRTLRYLDFHRFNDREYPTVWRMVNHLEPGRSTTVTVREAQFNLSVDPDVFTQRNLENSS